jgi:phasin family protein
MTDVNETMKTLNEMGATTYDNLRKLGELQMNTWNQVLDKQMETFNLLMGNVVSQAELNRDSKDYAELMKGQMALNQKLTEELVNKTRESAEFVQQVSEDYRGWTEAVVKQATDKLNDVAKKVA